MDMYLPLGMLPYYFNSFFPPFSSNSHPPPSPPVPVSRARVVLYVVSSVNGFQIDRDVYLTRSHTSIRTYILLLLLWGRGLDPFSFSPPLHAPHSTTRCTPCFDGPTAPCIRGEAKRLVSRIFAKIAGEAFRHLRRKLSQKWENV